MYASTMRKLSLEFTMVMRVIDDYMLALTQPRILGLRVENGREIHMFW